MKKRFVLALCLLTLWEGKGALAQTNEREATRLNNQALAILRAEPKAPREGLQMLRRAMQLNPEDEIIRKNYVLWLCKLNQYKEALIEVNEAIHVFPNNSRLQDLRIDILGHLNLRAAAEFESLKQYAAEGKLDAASISPGYSLIEDYNYPIRLEKATPQPGEIRLDGLVTVMAPGRLTLSSMLFVLPNKRFRLFEAPKSKTALVAGLEAEYENLGSIPFSQLRSGDFIAVIGKDTPKGFVASRVVCAPRTPEEEAERGSPFDVASILAPEEAAEYPSVNESTVGEATFKLGDGPKANTLFCQSAAFVRDGSQTALLTTLSSFVTFDAENEGPKEDADELQLNPKLLATTTEIRGLKSYGPRELIAVTLPVPTSHHVFVGADVVAVPLKESKAALPLATTLPKRGEHVFLGGWYGGDFLLLDATVAYADANRLILHSTEQDEGEGLPGSVVVNGKGEVIGMQAQGSREYIAAVSVEALRRAMKNLARGQ